MSIFFNDIIKVINSEVRNEPAVLVSRFKRGKGYYDSGMTKNHELKRSRKTGILYAKKK